MEEWKKCRLGEICKIYGRIGFRGYTVEDLVEDADKGAISLSPTNLIGGVLDLSKPTYISWDKYYESPEIMIEEDDVVIVKTGSSVGRTAIIRNVLHPMTLNPQLVVLKDVVINKRYLGYLVKSRDFQGKLASIVVGSAIPTLSQKNLANLVIRVPSKETQERIACILSALDDKIELNNRINHNLEQQIQSLYIDWFIDNPKTEWATIALSEVATFVSGYSYKGNEIVDSSETAMATIKNFERNGGFKLDGYKPVSPSSKLKEEQHAELFDILVAHTDLTQNAEVIGNAEIILSKDSYSDIIFSMDLVKVVAKESFPYQFLLALLLKNPNFKSHCIGYVNGTTVLHMNKRALPDFNTKIPTCEEADRMNEIAKAIFTKMYENLCEIANLTKLRDSLLPKLMSGELKINEIDC